MKRLIILLILVILPVASVAQQQDKNVLYRRAKLLMRSGELDRGIALLEELHKKYPNNIVFFNDLKDGYTSAEKYEDLLSLLEARVQRNPSDWRSAAEAGDALFKLQRDDEALSRLQTLADAHRNSSNVYRIIAVVLYKNRRFSEIERLYTEAQKRAKNPSPFIMELARHFSLRLNYRSAAAELVKLVTLDPGTYGYVKQQISRFRSDSTTHSEVISVIRAGIADNPARIELRRLLADYYFRAGRFNDAFLAYADLDSLTHTRGEPLFSLARELKNEGRLTTARKSLSLILNRYPASEITPRAFFELAEVQRLSEESSRSPSRPEPIIIKMMPGDRVPENPSAPLSLTLYDSLVIRYPRSPLASRALLRIGEIQLHRLDSYDDALRTLDKALSARIQPQMRDRALLLIAEAKFRKGDVRSALDDYTKLARSARTKPVKQMSLFREARIEFYSAHFDTALRRLNDLMFEIDMDDEIMNDALSLSLLIDTAKDESDGQPLALFARAELLAAQGRLSESAESFSAVGHAYPESAIADDAEFRSAELNARIGLYGESVQAFSAFLKKRPDSDLADKALLAIAEIHELSLEDKPRAVAYYERLLADYPRSLYADRVRDRIRLLSEELKIN